MKCKKVGNVYYINNLTKDDAVKAEIKEINAQIELIKAQTVLIKAQRVLIEAETKQIIIKNIEKEKQNIIFKKEADELISNLRRDLKRDREEINNKLNKGE